jgi:hypothetical protein
MRKFPGFGFALLASIDVYPSKELTDEETQLSEGCDCRHGIDPTAEWHEDKERLGRSQDSADETLASQLPFPIVVVLVLGRFPVLAIGPNP